MPFNGDILTTWAEDLFGDDWEEYCGPLLRQRHGSVTVQRVPAIKGDLGIDYWVRGSCEIYQCYSPEPGTSRADRLRLQKTKLRGEVRKLVTNDPDIAALLKPGKCRYYIFLVPVYDDKDLLQYATNKAEEVRSKELEFCLRDFEIVVQDLEDFASERSAIQRAGLARPRLSVKDPEAALVHDWLTDNGELARRIREKVAALGHSSAPADLDTRVHRTVSDYLRGQGELSELESRYPDLYEHVRREITARQRRLRALAGRPQSVPADAIREELDTLTEVLSGPNVRLDNHDATAVATGTLASWLAECHLDPR